MTGCNRNEKQRKHGKTGITRQKDFDKEEMTYDQA